jgi:hypothetical protein
MFRGRADYLPHIERHQSPYKIARYGFYLSEYPIRGPSYESRVETGWPGREREGGILVGECKSSGRAVREV